MIKRINILIISLILSFSVQTISAQKIKRVEPPNWWTGMKNENLQLMIYGKKLNNYNLEIDYPGIKIKEVITPDNPDYLFVNIIISKEAKPGTFNILFKQDDKVKEKYKYQLLERKENSANRSGFNSSDVIYLIMPDRFANANSSNDNMPHMLEKLDRDNPDGRHGGDLQGISNHIDYIKELGATALWLNPVYENNQKKYSYHGYSITDYYKVDPRLGTNDEYNNLVSECHTKGLKVIMDMIFNHCGSNHWWMDNLPDDNWIHSFPEFTRTNYRASVVVDPYASKYDSKKMQNGWFDKTMPDLNQDNPLLATYLIQNSIWWIEYSGIDGIRMDTEAYPSQRFMTNWSKHVHREYPDFTILGEVWIGNAGIISYWNTKQKNSYISGLNSLFDYPLYDAIKKGFNEEEAWSAGMVRMYDVLTEDFLYKNPSQMIVFADNHDVERLYSMVNEDYGKFKNIMAFILTTRGVPLIYYGDEILMTGLEKNGHGDIRKDFPGGWPNDTINAFVATERSTQQNEAFDYVSKLLNYRKNSSTLQYGKLKHFIPEDGIYVYFRYINKKECIMIILNNRDTNFVLKTERFNECLKNYSSALNIVNNEYLNDISKISIQAKEPIILELKNNNQ